jgi:hypothetical protein
MKPNVQDENNMGMDKKNTLHRQRCGNGCEHAKPAPGYVKYLIEADLQCIIEGKKVRDLTRERVSLINQVGCASYNKPE